MMSSLATSTTLKSTLASVVLHLLFVAAGSLAIYQNSIQTLEFSGSTGIGNAISLSGFSSGARKAKQSISTPEQSSKTTKTQNLNTANLKDTVSVNSSASLTSTATAGTEVGSSQGGVGIEGHGEGSGRGAGTGSGEGKGDGIYSQLFSQIKSFFENRLGNTLNIREEQLIKIKVSLNSDGDILDANLIQGNLERNSLRKVITVAKSIPLKNLWKMGSFPRELIIPLVLTPQ